MAHRPPMTDTAEDLDVELAQLERDVDAALHFLRANSHAFDGGEEVAACLERRRINSTRRAG